MPPKHDLVLQKIIEIETEMKRAGVWQEQPLPQESYNFQKAFAMDTMAFTLQFVFIPRVKEIVAEKGEFPSGSMVGTQAVREFDGDPRDTSRLQTLLSEFDGMFG